MSSLLKRDRTPQIRKEVLLLRPLDYRGETLTVERETDNGVYCKMKNGLKHLFIKWGPAWTFPNVIRFFGVEGTPLTPHPTLEGVEIPIPMYLKEVWGEDPKDGFNYYEKLPDELRFPLETDMGIICGIKATMPDENMELGNLNADSILQELDIQNMENFGKAMPKKNALKDNIQLIVFGVLCFFFGAFAVTKGWV